MLARLRNSSVGFRLTALTVLSAIGIAAVLILNAHSLNRAMRDGVSAKTRDLVQTASGILEHFHSEEQSGRLTRQQAQNIAASTLRTLRYRGQEYFWINDMQPRMIMHPFSTKLEGQDLSNNQDPNGLKPFVLMVDAVKAAGGGFVHYSWPKPGAADPQPKVSYVQGFAPWGWVVGSGVYLDDLQAAVRDETIRLALIAALVAALTIGGAVLVRRSITAPIKRLTDRMTDLARGDHASVVPDVQLTNEFGRIARSVETFREAALEKSRLEGEAVAFQHRLDGRLRETEAAFSSAGEEQKRVVDALASALARLADGDLTVRLTDAVASEYVALRDDFNDAMHKLQDLVGEVSTSTIAIRSGSGEISSATGDLSRRTEQQASSLEKTAAALDEITATVRRTAESANHASAVVTDARTDAERSGRVVEDAVKAMGAIERSAHEISQIIGVIDEIAFQTNLLALNAGVEAARAGETGKGFAVVASEVRALAQRSADAAKEIKGLISTSSTQVASGVALVGEAGSALARIVSQVGEIAGIVGEITASAREQAGGLGEVNTAVNHMDQVTQQNVAMVDRTMTASHSLLHDAEALSNQIGRFTIGTAAATRQPVRSGSSAKVIALRSRK